MIGISGVSKRLAVSCNSMPMLRMNPNGLPLSFAIRNLLLCQSSKEASIFIKTNKFAIPQNLLLATEEGIEDYEISGYAIENYKPTSKAPYILHTNYPLLNDDFKTKNHNNSTCNRFMFLDSFLLSKNGGEIGINEFDKLMKEAPVNNKETYLRYLVSFPRNGKPTIILINPYFDTVLNLSF